MESFDKGIERWTLNNANGMSVSLLNMGAAIQTILVPNRDGDLVDVCLGYKDVYGYIKNPPYLGAIVGRHANRIRNAHFCIGDKSYSLCANENATTHIHGGALGFCHRLWQAEEDGGAVVMHLFSPDGEEGYPANLQVSVKYSLNDSNELKIEYSAISDADTVINLTNHCYFNLGGEGSGDILNHELMLQADTITEIDSTLCTTGKLLKVCGTPFDFRTPKPIGRHIFDENEQLAHGQGYDHNYVLGEAGVMRKFARVYCARSGIIMEAATDQPAVQLYSGNMLYEPNGKHSYTPRHGFCLETQHYPNSMEHPSFPSVILPADREFKTATNYTFGIDR